MSKLDGLVKEIRELKPDDYVRLQKKLARHEQALWEAESEAASAQMKAKGVTDEDIDSMVMRRRCKSRGRGQECR